MVVLPATFINQTKALMGEALFSRFLSAFEEEAPVSIRLSPHFSENVNLPESASVPWCSLGLYLDHRPNFTFDPLLHAGCYYVQEAASMFIHHVLKQHVSEPVAMLDLCAAPGGKSTAAIAALPEGSVLYANEPMKTRASILLENVVKWGYPQCYVTNNYPRDYRKSGQLFDVILCDVPCSGEGMFRKDPATIAEWSPQNVEKCWQLQRTIVSDAWACLRPGGLLVYSTCTFNTFENEANIDWMMRALDAQPLPLDVLSSWQITGSLLAGFEAPVYRFIPGVTRSEGLFVCILQKPGHSRAVLSSGTPFRRGTGGLHLLTPPQQTSLAESAVDVDYATAISYLRGEALVLPEGTPRGIVAVSFKGHRLGLAKNIGTRANNLYPKEWRIKSTHIPADYERVLPHEDK